MFESRAFTFAVGLIALIYFARPALAFGAGNIAGISKIEGQNWRHGDIEDALLKILMAKAFGGKKFTKHNVARVYFGNWLRDYSQAIDVGTVKSVSAEAIRLLLSVLGFMTFGFGSKEFEVTTERLGCYRPEEHIDNPKSYADNEDARRYDRRLRGPVNERVELAIDPETGMKNYIANERAGITTSAGLCRDLLGRSIKLGRRFARTGDKAERNESLRLMGTALHCLEDYFAHSNYVELALIEMGERDVFPHVGRSAMINLVGAQNGAYPIVTGTFGGVDFMHSVTGEVSDKLTQNEVEELEQTLKQGKKTDTSVLRGLLDMIPDGIFGGEHESDKVNEIQHNAASAQVQSMNVSPREPEEYTRYVQDIFRQIMPAIEWHDNLMKKISNAMEKIPVLPKILEQLEEQLAMFIFSVIAPFILPIITQIKNELKTGSDEIISSSEREQHIVFHDDHSTDPTHSMLAKDHFSNILNEVAGRCAAYTVRWAVPQIMAAIDDEGIDINRTADDIINGILCHPAHRNAARGVAGQGRGIIFGCVEEWWKELGSRQKDDYRRKLSRSGVQNGENHKEGVHDTGHGHGCVGKLKMRKQFGEPETWEDKVASSAADTIFSGASGAFGNILEQNMGMKMGGGRQPAKGDDGGLGGLLGAAGSLLGLGGKESKREDSGYAESGSRDSKGYTATQTSRGRDDDGRYKQSVSSQRYGDDGGYSQSRTAERQDSHGGGYTQSHTSQQYGASGGYAETQSKGHYGQGGYTESQTTRQYGGGGGGGGGGGYVQSQTTRQYGDEGHSRAQEHQSYGRPQEHQSYGRPQSSGRPQEHQSYGGGGGGGYQQQQQRGYGRDDSGDEKKYRKKKDDSDDEKKYRKKKDDSGDEKKYRKKKDDSDDDKKYRKKKDDSDDDKKYRKKKDDSDDDKKYRKKKDDSDDDRKYRRY